MNTIVPLNVGELFSGAGGLSLGFILADHPMIKFQPVFAVDNDKATLETYKRNLTWLSQNAPETLPHIPPVFQRDIEKLNTSTLMRNLKINKNKLDLLIGGPPCQGFSSSNKSRESSRKADRNRMTNVFLDKVAECRPKMFLIENVQGVKWTNPTNEMTITPNQPPSSPEFKVNSDNVRDFLIARATSLGYCVWHGFLDAVNFGVPQHRVRFFMFGVRRDIPNVSEDTVNLDRFLRKLIVSRHISVDNAIGDLPPLKNGEVWEDNNYHPNDNTYIQKLRRFMDNGDLYDHFTARSADYVIDRYRKIPEGRNWEAIRNEMSITYKKVDNTHSNIYRRLNRDIPAITISHYRKSMLIHPWQDRGLSFREACRLQSFPDWFRFEGGSEQMQQQLANAVPPLMAAAVAHSIGEFWLEIAQ